MSGGEDEVRRAAEKKVSFGLIGMGRHGSRYAAHLLEDVPQARLVAVSRRDQKAGRVFARQHGLTFYGNYRQLVEDQRVQAIAVAVSPDLHLDICRRAVEAGKHILLEKPLARNLAEGQQIHELFTQSRVKFMLAQTLRFNSVVREIKRIRDRLGPIHLMACNLRMEPHGLAWLDDPQTAGGGNILHNGVHIFDLIHFLLEDEVEWAWCRREIVSQRRTEDLFAAVLGLQRGGTICLVDSCKVTGGRSGRIELVGERGQLVADHVLGTLALIEGRRATALPPPPPVHTVQKTLEAFAQCILTDGDPSITTRDGLRTLQVAEMCYRSAESGQAVQAEAIRD
jgi:predicted dehydrogenase